MSPINAIITELIINFIFGAIVGLQLGALINFITQPTYSAVHAIIAIAATIVLVKGCRLIQYINSGVKHVN